MDHSSRSSSEPDYDCDIYVNASSPDRLMELLSGELRVEVDAYGSLVYRSLEVECGHNDYEETAPSDSYLGWRFVLDVQVSTNASIESAASDIRDVLDAIRRLGYKAKPSCECEYLLIDGDGERS